jgi:beta-N-acetylhexosaminidase
MNRMRSGSLHRVLGQLFVVGFDGTDVTQDLEAFITYYQPFGVILFKRNIKDPEQLFRLTSSLQKVSSSRPLVVAIDQEGGRVWRLPSSFTYFPEATLPTR